MKKVIYNKCESIPHMLTQIHVNKAMAYFVCVSLILKVTANKDALLATAASAADCRRGSNIRSSHTHTRLSFPLNGTPGYMQLGMCSSSNLTCGMRGGYVGNSEDSSNNNSS